MFFSVICVKRAGFDCPMPILLVKRKYAEHIVKYLTGHLPFEIPTYCYVSTNWIRQSPGDSYTVVHDVPRLNLSSTSLPRISESVGA